MNHDSFDLRHMPSLGKAMVLLFMLLLPLTAFATGQSDRYGHGWQ